MSYDFSQFDAVLLDLDGTLYHEDHPLPGAAELIRRLEDSGKPFACLSNSTSSPGRIVRRLTRMGMSVNADHIYTAALAAVDYVIEKFGKRPRVFNLATEGTAELLRDVTEPVESAEQPCDAVIIGAPANVYATADRQRTALLLLRRGAAAVGICADRVYPSQRGLELGSGALTTMLAYAAAVTPVFCGKPEAFFFLELCRRLGVRPEGCVLIGDNLESDVAGANKVGMRSIVTLTGVARREDVAALPAEHRPIGIVEDLTELL